MESWQERGIQIKNTIQSSKVIIGGLQRISLIDYPGKISAVVFLRGCNFRCGYCHNPELVLPKRYPPAVTEDSIFSFLRRRRDKLDAVVVTGGEPTVQPRLTDFLRKIKRLGLLLKLDTNGSNPKVIKEIIDQNLADYFAMDIKGSLEKYRRIVGYPVSLSDVRQSVQFIMNSEIDYEFRTTVVRSQLSLEDFLQIGKLIVGARLYILQKFVPSQTLSQDFLKEETYSDREFKRIQDAMANYVQKCIVR